MLTVNVIDFEEKLYFILRSLASKLMNRVNKLLEGDGATVIFIKYLEDSLHEEWLKLN